MMSESLTIIKRKVIYKKQKNAHQKGGSVSPKKPRGHERDFIKLPIENRLWERINDLLGYRRGRLEVLHEFFENLAGQLGITTKEIFDLFEGFEKEKRITITREGRRYIITRTNPSQ